MSYLILLDIYGYVVIDFTIHEYRVMPTYADTTALISKSFDTAEQKHGQNMMKVHDLNSFLRRVTSRSTGNSFEVSTLDLKNLTISASIIIPDLIHTEG
jgi:hypothetical protein